MTSAPDRIPPGRIRLTYDDYAELPDDGKRYELVDGELEVSPAPPTAHQIASMNLSAMLHAFVKANGLGRVLAAPIDVVFAETTILQPDIVYVRAERQSIVTSRGIEGAPDLVVEIVSSSSLRRDRTTKPALYARFGVGQYWVADPGKRAIELYEREAGAYRLVAQESGAVVIRPALFPGLSLSVAEIWD
jgi:Uma2 family endonuclease